mgnify:CR=1 FL=1
MTINYYQQNADSFVASTVAVDMTSLYAPFIGAIEPNGLILDAGCGSGRDAKAFADMGYRVEAFDASPAMVERAAQHSGLAVRQVSAKARGMTASGAALRGCTFPPRSCRE